MHHRPLSIEVIRYDHGGLSTWRVMGQSGVVVVGHYVELFSSPSFVEWSECGGAVQHWCFLLGAIYSERNSPLSLVK